MPGDSLPIASGLVSATSQQGSLHSYIFVNVLNGDTWSSVFRHRKVFYQETRACHSDYSPASLEFWVIHGYLSTCPMYIMPYGLPSHCHWHLFKRGWFFIAVKILHLSKRILWPWYHLTEEIGNCAVQGVENSPTYCEEPRDAQFWSMIVKSNSYRRRSELLVQLPVFVYRISIPTMDVWVILLSSTEIEISLNAELFN